MASGSPTAALPVPGDVVVGKYRIERLIGSGGMGAVYRAQHLVLDQPVAIKVLLPEAAGRPDAVSRFLNEARAASRIRGEHVAAVLDVGTLDGGLAYMVLEYLDGTDLGEVLRARTTLPVREAVDIVLEALEAIAQAHALGIVHRDIKPANLFLARRHDGATTVKVLDFGISKVTTASSMEVTSSLATLGSPAYMSPEQVRSSKSVDARTDVWSIGVVLYRMLGGHAPFEGESIGAVFASILEHTPTPLGLLRPELPRALSNVVALCLERDRERRCPDVARLAGLLEPFASRQGRRSVEDIRLILRSPVVSTPGEPQTRSVPPPGAFSDTVAVAAPSTADLGGRPVDAPASTGPAKDVVPPTSPEPEARTGAAWTTGRSARPWNGRIVALVVAGGLVVGVAALALTRRDRGAVPAAPTGIAAAVTVSPPPAPAPSAPDTIAALPAAPAPVATTSPAASASAAPPPRRATPRPAPATPSAPARSATVAPPAASAPASPFDDQSLSNRR